MPWRGFLQLVAVTGEDRAAATARIRDAFSAAGGWITDVHFFSGVQTVFTFEVAAEQLASLGEELRRATLELDGPSQASLDAATRGASGEVRGTLAVVFARGDTDMTHDVPAVPG